jgi:hypothetical protein
MAEYKLNARQVKFAYFYACCGNGTKAAKQAGYAEPSAHTQAHDLLKNPKIAAEVERHLTAAAVAAGVTPETIARDLVVIRDRCMQSKPSGEASEDGDILHEFNHAGALKSTELLGKLHALWIDKKEITGAGGKPLDTTWTIINVKAGDPNPNGVETEPRDDEPPSFL